MIGRFLTLPEPDPAAAPRLSSDSAGTAKDPSSLATHAASDPATAPRATFVDRFAAWCKEVTGDLDELLGLTVESCAECERPCANVLPDVPTANPCAGRIWIGQCADCGGETVELAADRKCFRNPLHIVANKREKSYPYHRPVHRETTPTAECEVRREANA